MSAGIWHNSNGLKGGGGGLSAESKPLQLYTKEHNGRGGGGPRATITNIMELGKKTQRHKVRVAAASRRRHQGCEAGAWLFCRLWAQPTALQWLPQGSRRRCEAGVWLFPHLEALQSQESIFLLWGVTLDGGKGARAGEGVT